MLKLIDWVIIILEDNISIKEARDDRPEGWNLIFQRRVTNLCQELPANKGSQPCGLHEVELHPQPLRCEGGLGQLQGQEPCHLQLLGV